MAVLKSQLVLSMHDGVSAKMRAISGMLRGFQAQNRRLMAPLGGTIGRLAAFGAGYLGVTEGLKATAGAAMEFESAMSDVRKVVELTDEQFANVRNSIIGMSRELPITASGIAAIYAAAGQADVPTEELNKFTEMVAKVSTAWDMPVEETGQALAEIKNQLGMNVADISLYADAINELGNKTAARAPDLVDFAKRVAGTGEMYGFGAAKSPAFGASMISNGAQAEVAATSFRNMGKALTKGTTATKGQKKAYAALGLDAVKTAKNMQKNAVKTTLDVIDRIQKLPEWQRISIASQLFGDEARALVPLINKSGDLRDQLRLVGDAANYSGSSVREYLVRAGTVSNVLQIMRNKIADVFRGMGDKMLPYIKDAALGVSHVLDTLGERATVFDRIKNAIHGFAQGFGMEGGVREFIEDLGDVLFGKADGGDAGEQLGRTFIKFKEWGASVREFSDAVKDNPVAKFLGSLTGYGFGLMASVFCIGLLASAVRKLAGALFFLSGASAAVSIIKGLADIGGLLGGGAVAGAGGSALAGGGLLAELSRLLPVVSGLLAITGGLKAAGDDYLKSGKANEYGFDKEKTKEGTPAWYLREWLRKRDAPPASGPADTVTAPGKAGRVTPQEPLPERFGPPLPQQQGEIKFPDVMTTRPSGAQQVQVTNPVRPNVSTSVTVNVTSNASPEAIGAAVGAAVGNAVEGTFTDGAM